MDYEMKDLLPLVRALAKKYAGYEHTSITYEKAEQLMAAVLYCIGEVEKSDVPFAVTGKTSAEKVYQIGKRLVEEKVKKSLELYNRMLTEFSDYGNTCLRNSFLKELPSFFMRYDCRFEPQNTKVLLTYPVFPDISDDTGIDRIWKFLFSVSLEQRFLRAFPEHEICNVLLKYEISEESENLCGIILKTAIMNALSGKKPLDCGFTQEERGFFWKSFLSGSKESWKKRLRDITEQIVQTYCGADEELADYLTEIE